MRQASVFSFRLCFQLTLAEVRLHRNFSTGELTRPFQLVSPLSPSARKIPSTLDIFFNFFLAVVMGGG